MHALHGRRARWAASAALAAGLASASAAPAADVIIGGRSEACSIAAKASQADPLALENCTMALLGEPLHGHSLAATYVNRGTMFLALMNWGSALSDFDQAIAAEPAMPEAWVNRGGALIGLHRFKEAVENIDKGIALMPEEPEKAYGNRALARWSLDDLKGAYEDFLKAQELKPDWPWPAEQLAQFTVETAGVAGKAPRP
jgi:tetratricopeptide (TPR) repeat protein